MISSALIFSLLTAGLTQLTTDFGVKFWFLQNDPLIQELDRTEKLFGGEDKILISARLSRAQLDRETLNALTRAQLVLESTLDVYQSQGLANFPLIMSEGEDEQTIANYLGEELHLSDEGPLHREMLKAYREQDLRPFRGQPGYANILLILKPEYQENTRDYRRIQKDLIQKMEQIKAQEPLIEELSASGIPLMAEAFRSSSLRDILTLLPLVGGIIYLFLFFYFGSWLTALLPLVLFTISVAATFGLSGYLQMPIHSISSIVPAILLTIGLADAQHIFSCHPDDLKKNLAENFLPTLFTTLTTTAGFLSFALSDLVPLSQMGILMGVGVLLAWLATYTLLAPLVVLAPHTFLSKRFRPHHPFRFKNIRSRWVYLLCLLALAPAMIGLKFLTVETNPYQYFAEETWFQQNYQEVNQSLQASPGPEIIITSTTNARDPEFLKRLESFHHALSKREAIRYVRSPITELQRLSDAFYGGGSIHQTPQRIGELFLLGGMMLPPGFSFQELVEPQEKSVRFSLLWNIEDSAQANDEIQAILKLASSYDLEAKATGRLYLYYRMTDYLVSSFLRSYALAVFTVSLLLYILFRRLDYALLSLIPNLVPMVIGFGLLPAIGLKLETTTVLVGSMCYGLAVDDTIHLLWHYHKNCAELDPSQAANAARDHLWRPLSSTSLILAAGMAVMGLSHFLPNARFGLLASFILLVALLSDLFLLPQLIKLLPKRGVL